MTLITISYTLLLLIFIVFAGFIFRHTRKYGYLSPKFTIVIMMFGLMALATITFSLYLMIQLYKKPDANGGISKPLIPMPQIKNELNF